MLDTSIRLAGVRQQLSCSVVWSVSTPVTPDYHKHVGTRMCTLLDQKWQAAEPLVLFLWLLACWLLRT